MKLLARETSWIAASRQVALNTKQSFCLFISSVHFLTFSDHIDWKRFLFFVRRCFANKSCFHARKNKVPPADG